MHVLWQAGMMGNRLKLENRWDPPSLELRQDKRPYAETG